MKSRKIVLIALMISMLLVAPVFGQYLYLIQNDCSTDKWITQSSNCIFNQTQGVWQLNSTDGEPPEYVNFTTFNEAYSAAKFDQTEDRSSWTGLERTDEGIVYNNNYAEIADPMTVYFKLMISSVESNAGGTILVYPVIFAEGAYPDYRHMQTNNYEAFGVRVSADLSQSSTYFLSNVWCQNGDNYGDTVLTDLDVGTAYWIRLQKDGTSFNTTVFSDSAFSSYLGHYESTLAEVYASEDCLCVPLAHDAASGDRESSGYVEFMTFDEPTGGFELSGQLYTEDLLVNTTMAPAYVFCSSQLVPDNTALTVEFSEDNSTWVRPITLSSTVGNLRESVYLADLNYSSLYVRYNFTSDGSATPAIDTMEIAYQIDEPEGNANGWIYTLCASPIALIVGIATKLKKGA